MPTTPTNVPLLPLDDLGAGKRRYLHQFASALTMNTYLKLLCAILAILAVLQQWQFHGLRGAILTHDAPDPEVYFIDLEGRTVPVDAARFDPERHHHALRFHLRQFVQDHYRRVRALLPSSFTSSLHYLDRPLATAALEAFRETELNAVSQPNDIEIEVLQVIVPKLVGEPPYEAIVDFEKVHKSPATGRVTNRDRVTVTLSFAVVSELSPDRLAENPIGLIVTHITENAAFERSSR